MYSNIKMPICIFLSSVIVVQFDVQVYFNYSISNAEMHRYI